MMVGKRLNTEWIPYSSSSATCGSAYRDLAWREWNGSYSVTSSSSTCSTSVWLHWNAGWLYQGDLRPARMYQADPRPAPALVTPEEAATRRRIQAEDNARRAEANQRIQAEARQADEKARKLLVECLSPEQRASFEQHGYFDVQIADGRRFRIKKGWSHNVFELNAEGKPLRSLCAHSREAVPEFDNMLAQKLWLEIDPDRFLQVANKGPLLIN